MKLKILSIYIIVVILLCSCVEEKRYMANSKSSYIKCYVGNIPNDFSPAYKLDFSQYNGIFNYLFEGLVSQDKGGNIESALADKWSISNNGLEYQFHIRKSAKWSDGEAITSDDFVKLFKYALAPESKNDSVNCLFDIHGAEQYHAGKIPFGDVAIKAPDSETLKISLNKSCSDFMKILASTDFLLRDGSYELENLSENYSTIKFSGAFKIEKTIKEGIVLDKNIYYWNKNNINDNTFLFMEKMSCEEALAKFEGGDLDMIANPPVSEMERFMDSKSIIQNSDNVLALSFNMNSKSDSVLNEAVRTEIIKNLNLENIKEKGLKNYRPNNYEVFKRIYSPNMQQISADKAEVVKDKENDTGALQLLCINDGIGERIAQQICSQLKKKLGLKVYITICNYDEVKKYMEKGNFQMLLYNYHQDYDRQLGIFKNLISYSEDNFIGYKNSSFDKLMEKAFFLDDAQKISVFKQCESIIKNAHVYLPMYYGTDVVLSNDYLSGIDWDYNGYIDIERIEDNGN